MPARTRAGLALSEVVSTGLGTAHRDDPVSGRTGGPAGNARLTAWTGLLLLAAFGAECATLLGLRQLIGVHILVGAFLVPPALLKTGTTGWSRHPRHQPNGKQVALPMGDRSCRWVRPVRGGNSLRARTNCTGPVRHAATMSIASTALDATHPRIL